MTRRSRPRRGSFIILVTPHMFQATRSQCRRTTAFTGNQPLRKNSLVDQRKCTTDMGRRQMSSHCLRRVQLRMDSHRSRTARPDTTGQMTRRSRPHRIRQHRRTHRCKVHRELCRFHQCSFRFISTAVRGGWQRLRICKKVRSSARRSPMMPSRRWMCTRCSRDPRLHRRRGNLSSGSRCQSFKRR